MNHILHFTFFKKHFQKEIFLPVLFLVGHSVSYSQSWIRCSNGLPQDTAVSSLAKIGSVLYAGTEHAGVYKSIDLGNSWTSTGMYDPIRLPIVKAMTVMDTFLFAAQTSKGVARTSLNATSWTLVNNGIPKGNGNLSMFDIITVGDTLYAGSNGGGVFISADKGDHWSLLYDNLGLNDHRVLTLAGNSQFLFAGTAGTNYTMPDTGVVFVTSRNNGTAWTVMNNGLSRNGAHLEAVSGLTANDTVAYAGTDDVGIHRSIDNGQSWTLIPGTELNGDIWGIKIVGTHVYYGTLYHGIFTSNDGGITFYENNVGLNFGNLSIPDLVDDFVVLEPYLYAATSTGVYKQLLDPTTSVIESSFNNGSSSLSVFPNPFSTETTFKINMDNDGSLVTIRVVDIVGKEVRTMTDFLHDNPVSIKMNRGELAAGIYFYTVVKKNSIIASGKLIAK